jgi:hypothetical protein
MSARRWLMAMLILAAANAHGQQAPLRTRWHEYTAKFKTPKHPVEVKLASHVGGDGTEWLCGGAFQADGTLVLAGTALGPQLSLAGKKAQVLGADGPAPTVDTGSNALQTVSWQRADGAPFVAWMDPGLKEVRRVVRFAWGVGSACGMALDDTGAIYLAGQVGPNLKTAGTVSDVTAEDAERTNGDVFILKLSADGSQVLWGRTFANVGKGIRIRFHPAFATSSHGSPEGGMAQLSSSPQMSETDTHAPATAGSAIPPSRDATPFRVNPQDAPRTFRAGTLHRGNIVAEGEWGYVFKPDGKLDRVVKSGPAKGTKSINPVDWTVAFGWDSNTHTGREPWRKPGLRLEFAPETKRESQTLFPWDPKLVGTDKCRLVSDSSIRLIHFDDSGKMWAVGWSDGGNNVFERQALDLDKGVPKDGIGFSTWGARVGSFAHILRISTETFETTGKTLWSGYLTGKNQPAGGSVENLAVGTDGSPLLTGHIGYGLIQTGDNFSPEQGNAGGPYIAVLEPDFSSIRFSSAFLGCGKVKLHMGNNWAPRWNLAAQIVKGRHLAVFTSGAVKEEARQMGMVAAPAKNPVQKEYGGGIADGYVVVMDLGAASP